MSEKTLRYLNALKHQERMLNAIKNAQCIDNLAVDTGDFLEMALRTQFDRIRTEVIFHLNEFYESLREQAEKEMLSSGLIDLLIVKLSEDNNAAK